MEVSGDVEESGDTDYGALLAEASGEARRDAAREMASDVRRSLRSSSRIPRLTGRSQADYATKVNGDEFVVTNPHHYVFINENDPRRSTYRDVREVLDDTLSESDRPFAVGSDAPLFAEGDLGGIVRSAASAAMRVGAETASAAAIPLAAPLALEATRSGAYRWGAKALRSGL